MRRRTLMVTLSSAFVLVILAGASNSLASEEIARQEGLACTACHDKPGSKLLTDRGKYFELMGCMDGFEEIEAGFQRCTYCHRRQPGSRKLTKVGQQFTVLVGDMAGLLEWMRSNHPVLPTTDGDRDSDSDSADDSDSDSEEGEGRQSDGDLRPIPSH